MKASEGGVSFEAGMLMSMRMRLDLLAEYSAMTYEARVAALDDAGETNG